MRDCLNTWLLVSTPDIKLKKHFKDVVKGNLKNFEIIVKDWEKEACWIKLVFDGCNHFDHLKLKKAFRKGDVDTISEDIQSEFVCNVCKKVVLSNAVFTNH